jgi:hypothetical protein
MNHGTDRQTDRRNPLIRLQIVLMTMMKLLLTVLKLTEEKYCCAMHRTVNTNSTWQINAPLLILLKAHTNKTYFITAGKVFVWIGTDICMFCSLFVGLINEYCSTECVTDRPVKWKDNNEWRIQDLWGSGSWHFKEIHQHLLGNPEENHQVPEPE